LKFLWGILCYLGARCKGMRGIVTLWIQSIKHLAIKCNLLSYFLKIAQIPLLNDAKDRFYYQFDVELNPMKELRINDSESFAEALRKSESRIGVGFLDIRKF
jgi:hypothetical protein